jgi:hypothetical protein
MKHVCIFWKQQKTIHVSYYKVHPKMLHYFQAIIGQIEIDVHPGEALVSRM